MGTGGNFSEVASFGVFGIYPHEREAVRFGTFAKQTN